MSSPPRRQPSRKQIEAAIQSLRKAAESGHFERHPRIYGRLDELKVPCSEISEALQNAAREITADDYRPVRKPANPPPFAFDWEST